jgi:hypothetical protein
MKQKHNGMRQDGPNRSVGTKRCLVAGRIQFPGQTFSIPQPAYGACFASGPRYRGHDTTCRTVPLDQVSLVSADHVPWHGC